MRLEGHIGVNCMAEEKISGLLIAGLLAILGTVIGGVVKGYWDTSLANRDFQSKLILRSLESDDVNKRTKSLEFLVKTNLISDQLVKDGINQVLKEGEKSIPQFEPVNSTRQKEPGVNVVPSVKAQAIAANPALKDSILALVALKVRHGGLIDSITPIFAEIASDLKARDKKIIGQRIGGEGGGETLLEREGYLITGVDVYRGEYFGRDEVIQLQVIWHKLTPQGIDPTAEIVSEKLGSGNFAHISQPPKKFRADPGYYISDFGASTSFHTSGETFFHDIYIKQEKLPVGS
jgi:hypothetical protein